ncbi:Glycosyltransferase, GT2 family [Prevotella sp. ne3005]|uniref:glycosyltransferase family 2 protein n=1 Tax=Prevotella sp. ne3005 TaxID=1761887 RepID=UPI0008D7CE12|nr:glycosyltransferase family 2 protein [Prevotella sp. ne3005]SEM55075.1 Glycosyltransferase, GT2 family [Prevotella sp. ne3005]
MKRIAVLMTVHNRREKTLLCLEHLFANRLPANYAMTVYLTDDGCTDGTAEAVRAQYPSVQVLTGSGDLYWNRGMWTAWQEAAKADFDFYFWLNDDTFLYEDAIEALLMTSAQSEDRAIIVGATEDRDHHSVTYGGFVGTLAHAVIPPLTGQPVTINYFNGNVVLVPRAVYQVLGNLDPRFRHDKGDIDYGLRAQEAGIPMMMVGKPLGVCDLHPRADRWRDPELSLSARWQALRQPTGMAPAEFFYFDRKHHGVLTGLKHYLSIHLQCLFPQWWKNE